MAGRHQPVEGADSLGSLPQVAEQRWSVGDPVGPHAFILEVGTQKNGNVLALMFLPHNKAHHFAVGVLVNKESWMWGHYFEDVNAALYEWMERV